MNLFNFDKTVPYIRKRGVAGYFQLIFHNFFDLVLLNFIFLLCSLPIVTFGAAYTAFIDVCNFYAEDAVVYPIRRFFESFKRNFWKSTLYGLMFTAAFAVVIFSSIFYFKLSKQIAFLFVFAVISAACMLIIAMMFCWFFPLYAKTPMRFKNLLINSFLMSFANIKGSFAFLFVVSVCCGLIFAFFPYSIPFIAILPFMLICLCSSCAAAEKINDVFLKSGGEDEKTHQDDI